MTRTDRRLIEHYLPIEAISAEARREKSVRKGHISTLHLWWARRPLVAARAAVFGALVPQDAATPEFVAELCTYPGPKDTIAKAQQLILKAHAERLSAERGDAQRVTVEDIEAGRAPRPKVLDMFAGGGAIPLEALRLGCEAYALDLNPVAHLIELCTLVYPQKYGKPDPTAKGSANASTGSAGTWAGLAAEVEYWGKWVLERVKAEIGDLYPPIPSTALRASPDPRSKIPTSKSQNPNRQLAMSGDLAPGGGEKQNMLTPVAYLWTRTVRCKNPACSGTVPLARQTWLAKKERRFVALRPDTEANRDKPAGEKIVRYHVVEATTEAGLGFDPEAGSKGGNVACPFCGTVADSTYVKAEGKASRMNNQLIGVIATSAVGREKIYLGVSDLDTRFTPDDSAIAERLEAICQQSGISLPTEQIINDAKGSAWCVQYGFDNWTKLFLPRQLLTLMTFTKCIRGELRKELAASVDPEHVEAVATLMALFVDRVADFGSTLATLKPGGARGVVHTFVRQAIPIVWDCAEINPFGNASSNAKELLKWFSVSFTNCIGSGQPADVRRGSAMRLPYLDGSLDAVVTDPPYYDNVPYANLSDYFYVWLKRSVGDLHSDDFASELTPKKGEAVADASRHNADKHGAGLRYEQMMADAFLEANRVLKPGCPLVVVYAHKTTLGWSTLVDALRRSRFVVTEAWPLDTEAVTRMRAMDSSALASSIFLVARRREGNETGSYEEMVKSELETIVRERVETLWAKGITGADLVIACVGAGLRAFTRFARVEYANGEEVPADRFLTEVEGVVLDTLLEKLFGVPRQGVSAVDAATRFYVLWRYAYRAAAIDAGEAIIFALPQGVELDGPRSLSAGPRPLVEKQKSKYLLRDFTERGDDEKLGLPPSEGGLPTPLIDVLHRLLYLMENAPAEIPAYLDEARPNVEQLHLVAQTLAGSALAGNGSGGGKSLTAARGAEAAALRVLTTNWRTLIEEKRGSLV